jgi:uncharacterized membrane protein
MNEASMHLLIAAFDEESSAEQELNSLKASGEEKLAGIQAAIAIRKDEGGQLHFKDVGLTPGKGALGGVALGAVVGILTGGTGLALGALGALVGGVVGRRKRDSRFSADRVIWLVLGVALLFAVVLAFPLLREWLRIEALRTASDYLIVALNVAVWAIVLRAIWRSRLLNRYTEVMPGATQEVAECW